MAAKASSVLGRAKLDDARVVALLFPIAAFLNASGISAASAQRSFAHAMRRAIEKQSPRALETTGHDTVYADLISRWRRDKRYLDSRGFPRDLPMRGRDGFVSLVRSVKAPISAQQMLKILLRYGNVRRRSNGTYRLVTPMFSITSSRGMAFEPMSTFLSDVTSTFDQIARWRKGSNEPKLFWRKVETTQVPSHLNKQFIQFVGDRSLTFLEEIDDWLEAHSEPMRPNRRGKRLGLGVFSICSKAP